MPVFDESEMGLGSGELYDQAVSIVLRHKKASTSYIQRRLQIGYNRAASIMERMEKEGCRRPCQPCGQARDPDRNGWSRRGLRLAADRTGTRERASAQPLAVGAACQPHLISTPCPRERSGAPGGFRFRDTLSDEKVLALLGHRATHGLTADH